MNDIVWCIAGDVWKLISDYSQTIRGSGGGSSRGGSGQGVYYSLNANPRGRVSGSASNVHSTTASGVRIRKNVFEFIREKVLPTTTSHGTSSSSEDRYGGASATSRGRSHHGTSGLADDDQHSHGIRLPQQRTSSSQREEDSLFVDDGEDSLEQTPLKCPL